MEIDKSVKIGILSSVIATILFLYFIEPIFSLFGEIIFGFGSTIFRVFIDRLFEQSALFTAPDPSLGLLFFFFGILNYVLIDLTIYFFRSRLKNKKEELPNKLWINIGKKIHYVLPILVIILLVTSFMAIFSNMFQMRLISSFNQHIIAIQPYTSDAEIKLLKSRWTQMKSETDYKLIYKDIENVASLNNIHLPENKVYSLNSF